MNKPRCLLLIVSILSVSLSNQLFAASGVESANQNFVTVPVKINWCELEEKSKHLVFRRCYLSLYTEKKSDCYLLLLPTTTVVSLGHNEVTVGDVENSYDQCRKYIQDNPLDSKLKLAWINSEEHVQLCPRVYGTKQNIVFKGSGNGLKGYCCAVIRCERERERCGDVAPELHVDCGAKESQEMLYKAYKAKHPDYINRSSNEEDFNSLARIIFQTKKNPFRFLTFNVQRPNVHEGFHEICKVDCNVETHPIFFACNKEHENIRVFLHPDSYEKYSSHQFLSPNWRKWLEGCEFTDYLNLEKVEKNNNRASLIKKYVVDKESNNMMYSFLGSFFEKG